ncbi:MAG TPA: molybdopterin biosynthesis protein [Acidilobales archaeon]|nr:molybdopterin biosynthesis protein [Acidilobales archaeon]
MMRKLFHELVGLDEVEGIISKYVPLRPKGVEVVNVEEALNRVLAEDVYSPSDYPPFDRSEVDGYALRAEDTYGADEESPKRLRIIGSVEVGQLPRVEVGPGKAVEIATGAMIPRGANAVVMEEHTHREGNELLVFKPVAPGDNISTTSSDISMGDLIIRKGTLLKPHHIALMSGLGIDRVKVYKRINVAVFSTGNEIARPSEELRPGMIYDANSYFLVASLRELGANARYVGHLPDEENVMLNEIGKVMKDYDVIMTSGGTSAGLGDLVYRVFDKLGNPGVIVHGLRVKPGKPTVIAVADGKLLIGMPGFPLSCAMVFHKVVRPIIAKMLGIERLDEVKVKALMPYRLRAGRGRTWFIPVSIIKGVKGFLAYPVTLSSGSIAALTYADGYIVVPENKELVDEGDEVDVYLFSSSLHLPELVFMGSHDIALWRILTESGLITKSKVIVTGSLRGWYAIKRGEADIAPTHLLDEETGEYNVPYIDRLNLKGVALLVRGYARRIGFIVPKGNPKNIRSFRDLLRDDVMFVNRVKGSGVRVFVDLKLKELAERLGEDIDRIRGMVKGYTYEVRTHTAVAAAIAQGRADVGVGAEVAARMYGLDFIPLTEEVVDFLIRVDRIDKKSVRDFIRLLRSDLTKEVLSRLPGYRYLPNTGLVIYGA